MGCCSSRSSDSPASRVTRWRSTGIVALRDARLKEVPNEVLQVGNSLRTLDLTNNKLVEIPQEIGTLANMQRLVLAGNLIEIIPANIGYLQNLKILTLDRNRISILPEELGSLSNLQQLSVPQNFLLCLPKSIGDLRNMSVLNVSDNKLKELPESIGGCSSLEEFQANGIMNRIFVVQLQQNCNSLSPNLNSAFSASTKLTERLHGSSEFIPARQPNHNGPVPTNGWIWRV
ncbi:LAP4 protein isoform X3 [Zea mays]|uniref:LAP4 protein isoform X3 n=1 Tax=Zea mays TaxID=4577 RepID=UPI001652B03A|nr:LAP4 protein isoform X3 [Zea mays]